MVISSDIERSNMGSEAVLASWQLEQIKSERNVPENTVWITHLQLSCGVSEVCRTGAGFEQARWRPSNKAIKYS